MVDCSTRATTTRLCRLSPLRLAATVDGLGRPGRLALLAEPSLHRVVPCRGGVLACRLAAVRRGVAVHRALCRGWLVARVSVGEGDGPHGLLVYLAFAASSFVPRGDRLRPSRIRLQDGPRGRAARKRVRECEWGGIQAFQCSGSRKGTASSIDGHHRMVRVKVCE